MNNSKNIGSLQIKTYYEWTIKIPYTFDRMFQIDINSHFISKHNNVVSNENDNLTELIAILFSITLISIVELLGAEWM